MTRKQFLQAVLAAPFAAIGVLFGVNTKRHGLSATYSFEAAQELRTTYGLDVEAELAAILSSEVMQKEMN